MATKRKPTASRTKAAIKKKKTASAPAKKTSAAAKKPAAKPVAKASAPKPARPGKAPVAVKPVKGAHGAAPGKAAAPVKGAKSGRPIGRLKVVSSTPAVVRPIGALPPEAVARAVKAPAPMALRPARVLAPVRKPAPEPVADQGANGVTDKDYKEFEQRLLAERQKILKEMGHLENTVLKVNQRESAGDLSGYSFHMADVGTDAMEREKAFLFASNEGHLLQEIDHALRKVYRGEFGPCENCGRPITRARLEAMPYARLCLACKEEEERANRGPQ